MDEVRFNVWLGPFSVPLLSSVEKTNSGLVKVSSVLIICFPSLSLT